MSRLRAAKPRCWVNINRQGDVTHHSNSNMAWSRTPLYDKAVIDEAADALEAKDAEIERLRKDAERLLQLAHEGWWVGDWATYNDKLVSGENVNGSLEALRAAIDAAKEK